MVAGCPVAPGFIVITEQARMEIQNPTKSPVGEWLSGAWFFINLKEHATLSAEVYVDHGVELEATEEHANRAADRG